MTAVVIGWFVVGWLATWSMLYNFFFYSRAAYRYAGTTSLRWFLIPVVCIVVPLGLPAAIYYFFKYNEKVQYHDREKLQRREEKRGRDAERKRQELERRHQTQQLEASMKQHVQQELHNKGYH